MLNAPRLKLTSTKKGVAGFTLVESLITAAIVAILAAVAVPMYLSYVEAQRRSSVESLAQTAAVSANALYRRGAMAGRPQDTIAVWIKGTMFLPNPSAYNLTIDTTLRRVIVQDAGNTSIADTVNYR
jgi:prepilin-type N-terminal cleavage/methylation domain-containing protein